jgi:hypothetical protein
MAIDLAKKKVSSEKVASIAEKVLGGKQATREETRSLAAAALGVDGEKGGASSLAVKVVAGDQHPTLEEMKTLATSVVVQEFSTAIDRVRTLVADDNLLGKSDKNRIIKYLRAIEAITREYEPDRDRQVVNVLCRHTQEIRGQFNKEDRPGCGSPTGRPYSGQFDGLAANLAHCNIMVFCLLTAQEEATSADTFDLVDSGCR